MKERPVAVLDACVLVPMPVADTLLRLAEPPALYEARWTEQILAEVTRTLAVRFGKSREKALYRAAAMREFFPDALVANYQDLIADMKNEAKDRHVLAAAVACHADYPITLIGVPVDHLLDRLAGSVPGFVSRLRSTVRTGP